MGGKGKGMGLTWVGGEGRVGNSGVGWGWGVGGLGWDLGGDMSQVPGIEKILLFELKNNSMSSVQMNRWTPAGKDGIYPKEKE